MLGNLRVLFILYSGVGATTKKCIGQEDDGKETLNKCAHCLFLLVFICGIFNHVGVYKKKPTLRFALGSVVAAE